MMQGENLIWEAGMKAKAIHRQEQKRAKALEAGRESTAEPYLGLMHAMVKAAVDDLAKRTSRRGKGGQSVGAARLREAKLSMREVAFIGCRTVIDGISQGHSIQALTERIGQRVEDERNFRNFKRAEPGLWKWMQEALKERGSQDYRHKRNVVLGAMARTTDESLPLLDWSKKDRAHVGLVVLDALMGCGMLMRVQIGVGRGARPFLRLTPEAEAGLHERSDLVAELVRPWFKPTLAEPLDWASPTSGGYHTCDLPLVKTRNRQYVESLRQAEMPEVYETVNALQRTPWAVNEDVLVVAEEMWQAGTGDAGLPSREDAPKPPRPDLPPPGTALDEDQLRLLRSWKGDITAWYNAKARRQSQVTQTVQILEIADELRDKDAFWFPHQLDYRGRAYAIPLMLNPQGSDFARGLLAFAEAKPVGEMGGFWLAVHGANLWGEDKVRLEDRVDWVLGHEDEIRAAAADPLTERWWTGADAPWQFLAFCLEWAEYLDSGESPAFESRLPVSIDGSCNGLQHFSAMLRDPVGAAAVNLVAADVPQDIYQTVADRVLARVQRDAGPLGDDSTHRVARAWSAYGVDRGVVKRQVMTTPYGVTKQGMLDQLTQEMRKRADGEALPFESLWEACRYLSPIIYECIGATVASARLAMEYLQQVARTVAGDELPLNWVTPVGFPVRQEILRTRQFRIDTKLLGGLNLRYAEDTNKLDRRRQVTSAAPNFVHSYDAAHLCRTVVAMEAGRPRSWAVVHDSFGTHAGDVQDLSEALRSTFVAMYEDVEPLVKFAAQATATVPSGTGFPVPPAGGDFDLREVLEAEFFFA